MGSADEAGVADLILCGFEPFGGRDVNRSWQVVSAVEPLPGLETVQLPVDFAALRTIIPALAARARRALVLVGEAGGSEELAVERVALNVVHARIADNMGAQPEYEELIPGAPLARYATWDAAAVVATLAAAQVPAHVSHHAGTYACNAALYLALHAAAATAAPETLGFLHVPVASATETPAIASGITRLLLTFR